MPRCKVIFALCTREPKMIDDMLAAYYARLISPTPFSYSVSYSYNLEHTATSNIINTDSD